MYCQVCAPDKVKQTVVDPITMEQYQDADLDVEPVIVPDCGHLILKSTMDGLIGMADHYEMSVDGVLTGIKTSSEPFSITEFKLCPTCRGSLRNIARYGRLVRRGLLDDHTKKFVLWANNQFVPLAQILLLEQDRVANTDMYEAETDSEDDDLYSDYHRAQSGPSDAVLPYFELDLDLTGAVSDQMDRIRQCDASRHDTILDLQIDIFDLQQSVEHEEEPFQQVYELVQDLGNSSRSFSELEFASTVLQTGFLARTQALQIRCEIIIISDVLFIQSNSTSLKMCQIDFSENIRDCNGLIKNAEMSQLLREQIEGHIFAVQYYGLWCIFSKADGLNKGKLMEKARSHVDKAKALLSLNQGSTKGLSDELDKIELMLTGVFYQPITSEEMREVYTAMANEFSGAG
jgi:hypothetical protein